MVLAISLQMFAGAENLDLGLLALAYFGSCLDLALGFSHLFTLDYGTGFGPLPCGTRAPPLTPLPFQVWHPRPAANQTLSHHPNPLLTLGALGLRACVSGLALRWSGLTLHILSH